MVSSTMSNSQSKKSKGKEFLKDGVAHVVIVIKEACVGEPCPVALLHVNDVAIPTEDYFSKEARPTIFTRSRGTLCGRAQS